MEKHMKRILLIMPAIIQQVYYKNVLYYVYQCAKIVLIKDEIVRQAAKTIECKKGFYLLIIN